MENNPSPFVLPSLANALYLLASSLATLGAGIIGLLFGRRRQSAEIHKTNAEAGKTEAETRQIDSAIITNAYKRLDELELIARGQGLEITGLKQTVLTLEFDLRTAGKKNGALQAEMDLLNLQVQKARAQGFLAHEIPGTPNPAAGKV